MQIVFFCPNVTVINGGIKHIFRMAEVLCAAGYDAVVFEEQGRRPSWLETTAPVVGQGIFRRERDQILVLPEDQPQIFKIFATWPNRKIIYAQNHFYSVLGLGEASSYADFGIEKILCSSQTICDYMRFRHPAVSAEVVTCLVDEKLFKPQAIKADEIIYMPRKRPLEALYLRDMFQYMYPSKKNWVWTPVEAKSEQDVASLMGRAKVFLSLSRLEGFGLTPLEAMASGCIVAGFTGLGGREYATPDNGYWADEDDFPLAVECLHKATEMAAQPPENHARLGCQRATLSALQNHTAAFYEASVIKVWRDILGL